MEPLGFQREQWPIICKIIFSRRANALLVLPNTFLFNVKQSVLKVQQFNFIQNHIWDSFKLEFQGFWLVLIWKFHMNPSGSCSPSIQIPCKILYRKNYISSQIPSKLAMNIPVGQKLENQVNGSDFIVWEWGDTGCVKSYKGTFYKRWTTEMK